MEKPHDHVGSLENFNWHSRDDCLEEVNCYKPGDVINFSDLAKRYPITIAKTGNNPTNEGQVLKKFLEISGVDISKFQSKGNETQRIRRKKLRYTAVILYIYFFYFTIITFFLSLSIKLKSIACSFE